VDENRKRTRKDPSTNCWIPASSRKIATRCLRGIRKASPEDILVRVEVFNRGPMPPLCTFCPRLVRNRWSWDIPRKPELHCGSGGIELDEPYYGRRWLYAKGEPELLFTENESNAPRLWGVAGASPFFKTDRRMHRPWKPLHRHPEQRGTKAAAHYAVSVSGKPVVFELRLADSVLDDPSARVPQDLASNAPTRPTISTPTVTLAIFPLTHAP